MLKKISVILAILLLMIPQLCVETLAEDVWTYNFIIDGREVTITSAYPISAEAAYHAAYDFANYYIYSKKPDYGTGYHTLSSHSHNYVTVTATHISHKYYAEEPRCVEYIYLMSVCQSCGDTYTKLIDRNRIYCCGSDTHSPFDDVPIGAWYYNAACSCYARGYMSGTAPRIFSPKESLTRGMFAVILAKMDGADLSKYGGNTVFRDVPAGKWYSKAIKWAYENGYTSGIGGGLYGVNNSVTREQTAAFLYNYACAKGYGISQPANIDRYSDRSSVSSWAVLPMRWAVGAGLISGTSQNTLSPKRAATRAEIAVIIMRFAINVKKN